ncbi:hypothetical protein [Vallitalea okinawensis]|nr:hypothetical protein [Vallitalea okinawensis]
MKKIFFHNMINKNKKVRQYPNNELLEIRKNDFFLMEVHKEVMR